MARRRMFSLDVVDTDSFLNMPDSAQNLYFHMAMRADDDGFVSAPRKIQKITGASEDSLKLLVAKGYLIPFESGICVVRHWRVHNIIQKDRYTETIYQEEMRRLTCNNRIYETGAVPVEKGLCIQNGYKMDTQVRLGKVRKEKITDTDANAPDAVFVELAKLLCEEHRKRDPKFLVGKDEKTIFDRWARDIEKIARLDGREIQEIRNIILWCQENEFWNANILSGKKLREKFPTLVAQACRKQGASFGKIEKADWLKKLSGAQGE